MAEDSSVFRARAAAERENSEAATLDNVKERCDRAARTWDALAERAERAQALRDTREAPAIALTPAAGAS